MVDRYVTKKQRRQGFVGQYLRVTGERGRVKKKRKKDSLCDSTTFSLRGPARPSIPACPASSPAFALPLPFFLDPPPRDLDDEAFSSSDKVPRNDMSARRVKLNSIQTGAGENLGGITGCVEGERRSTAGAG